jgi:hypothetical protein
VQHDIAIVTDNMTVTAAGSNDPEDPKKDDESVDEHVIALASKGSGDQRSLIQSQMMSFKKKGSYDLSDDVYAFVTVAPVFSAPFLFAIGVICIKYIVYGTLLSGISFNDFGGAVKPATAVKFFLIPVAVAMQEDLMAVYAGLANARYDPKVQDISKSATRFKFGLSYFLRFCDGMLSLSVNFGVMLSTNDVLGVFLNFAALHFLQDIDDVFYGLVEKGFFGDNMEHMAHVCQQISWPRRVGSNKLSELATQLDTFLFMLTLLICMVIYFTITVLYVIRDPPV